MQPETPYKEWRMTEAERCGVHERTIDRWRKAGKFTAFRFRRDGRELWVSPFDPKAPPLKKDEIYLQRYDWSKVNLSLPNSVIARKLGCHQSAVYLARKRLKPLAKAA